MKNKVRKIAEEYGWAVHVQDEAPGYEWVEFSKYTPAGQDFSFSLTTKKDNIIDLCKQLDEYIESFDPDYEANFWQEDGHGIKGAPYRLKDIIIDFERAEDMMQDLLEKLYEIEEGEE